MPSLVSLLIALLAIYWGGPAWLRAIRRRRKGGPIVDQLDPLITIGLNSMPWLIASIVLVGSVAVLRFLFAWPSWVGSASIYLTGFLIVLWWVVGAILGVRIAIEDRRFTVDDQVT